MMEKLIWHDDDRFSVGQLCFRCTHDYSMVTNDDEIVILKRRPFIDFYLALLERSRPAHLLEVGFFEGGSSLLWAACFPEMRITAVDIRPQNTALRNWVERFADRLQLRSGVSQGNASAFSTVIKERGTPNMVIDDASHQYGLTRQTFELLFPTLARGEEYIIEDWGWGHWPGWKPEQWADAPTLSSLIAEFTIAAATSPEWIAGLRIDSRSCCVTRGGATGLLSLDALWDKRGRELSLPVIQSRPI